VDSLTVSRISEPQHLLYPMAMRSGIFGFPEAVIDAAPSIDPFGERMKSEMLVRLHKFAARFEPRMTLPNAEGAG
jgi:hypothetical protein